MRGLASRLPRRSCAAVAPAQGARLGGRLLGGVAGGGGGGGAMAPPFTGATFQRQHELPRLPVPSLEATLRKYVRTARPFLRSAGELRELEAEVAAALADPEVRRRQAALEALAAREDSYVQRMWKVSGYMQWRAALCINSNVTGYLFAEARKSWGQAFSAAACAHGALRFHVALLEGTVPVVTARGGKPTCMDQYTRMFSLNRVPGETEDVLVKYGEGDSRHIAVVAGRRIYTVRVLDERRRLIPLELLQASMSAIKAEAAALGDCRRPICVLSGTDRTVWARARNTLASDELNARSLAALESAILAVSLERGQRLADDDCARVTFHGDGATTWYDKSLTIKVTEDGNPSIHIEHSWADAPVPLDMFFSHALPWAEQQDQAACAAAAARAAAEPRPAQWPAHEHLRWNKTPAVIEAIRAAEEEVGAMIRDSDAVVHRARGLGRPVWKQAQLSPDAAVQMAMQLAYRRLSGMDEPVATYETIGMSGWLKGRTEACRVVSEDSERFVKNALAGWLTTRAENDRKEAERLLRAACDAHLKYIAEGQKGEGIDRHMFALRLQSKDGSQPKVFTNPAFAKSGGTGGFVLSSSNNSYVSRPLWGGLFGTVMPNGYGVCYIPQNDELTLCVESKRSCEQTNSAKFATMVDECLRDIATIAGVSAAKL
jgi:hypothetical protein